ncbi:MAG: AAA family ATPase [Candidatus Anstonellales archaeon]
MEELDITELRLIALSLYNSVKEFKRRDVVHTILSSLKKKPRIKLLRGFRGVGKTTAMLHAFGENKERSIYFSTDNPVVKRYGIYSIAKTAIKNGFMLLFMDEVHTYPKWREEIKALHDEFPSVWIVASGSAPLAFVPERREELICLHEMDMGEWILLKTGKSIYAGEEWMDGERAMEFIAANNEAAINLQPYARIGGFPLSLDMDEEKALDAIYNSIRKSIREDAVFFLKMSKEKVFAMENLLNFLATSKPGELSITSLSSSLHVSKTVVYEIVDALAGMEIIRVIRPYRRGASLVRAEPKLLFFHPNMRYAICKQLGKQPEIGAVREELAVFGLSERGWLVHTIKGEKKSPDYIIERGGERVVVEIGGEEKGRIQLREFPKGIVIKEHQLIPLLVAKSSKI